MSGPGRCEHLPTGKRKESGKAGLITGAECVEVVMRSRGITANLVKVVSNFPLQGFQLVIVGTCLYTRYGTNTVAG